MLPLGQSLEENSEQECCRELEVSAFPRLGERPAIVAISLGFLVRTAVDARGVDVATRPPDPS